MSKLGHNVLRRLDYSSTGAQASGPCPAPPRRTPRGFRVALCAVDGLGLALTPRRRLLAGARLWMLRRYWLRCARRERTHQRWYAAGGRRTSAKPPPRLTQKAFLEAWRSVLSPWGVGLNARTFQRWLRGFESGGVAALIDRRGCSPKPHHRAAIDGGLWGDLWRGLVAGRNVASMARELRPAARARGLAWPSLSTLRARLRGLRRATARNGHLLCGSRN